jgi:hypothetical protein
MTNIRMTAVDTIHISAVGPDNIEGRSEFVVPKHVADDLEERGLATRIGEEKADAPAENKMEPAPENKATAPITLAEPTKGRTSKKVAN